MIRRNQVSRATFAALVCALHALHAQSGALRGSVYDSVSRTRLVGALVQVAPLSRPADGRSARTDSNGVFAFDSLPPGSYVIGFLHPMLDSLGIEPPLRKASVAEGKAARMDLSIPLHGLRDAVCPGERRPDSSGVVIGIVRDARSHIALEGASVVAEWTEFRLTKRGIEPTTSRRTARTRNNGWFAICRVPLGAQIALLAAHDADSTGVLDLDLPKSGLARRDLTIGPAVAVAIGQAGDSVAVAKRHTGDVVLTGRVLGTDGRPVAQAHVEIDEGPEVITDDHGEWRIANAPLGTRELLVRALGFYPSRRVVDVAGDTPPLNVSLSFAHTILDTIRSRAARIRGVDPLGFEQRRRSLAGKFIGPEDIERLRPLETVDVFRRTPGIFVERDSTGFEKVLMRGGGYGPCKPAIFIDGIQALNLTADDINAFMLPHNVRGIEIYTTGGPPQYQTFNGCGSILIWTRYP